MASLMGIKKKRDLEEITETLLVGDAKNGKNDFIILKTCMKLTHVVIF